MICAYSTGGPDGRHDIADGQRRLDVTVDIDWGTDDERNTHEKTLSFCSFAHLAAWAGERGIQHDGRTVLKAEVADG